jgi:hypothetical protein
MLPAIASSTMPACSGKETRESAAGRVLWPVQFLFDLTAEVLQMADPGPDVFTPATARIWFGWKTIMVVSLRRLTHALPCKPISVLIDGQRLPRIMAGWKWLSTA